MFSLLNLRRISLKRPMDTALLEGRSNHFGLQNSVYPVFFPVFGRIPLRRTRFDNDCIRHQAVCFLRSVPETREWPPKWPGLLFRPKSLRQVLGANRALPTPVSLARKNPFLAANWRCNDQQSELLRQAEHLVLRDHSIGASRGRSMPIPRGSRPSICRRNGGEGMPSEALREPL